MFLFIGCASQKFQVSSIEFPCHWHICPNIHEHSSQMCLEKGNKRKRYTPVSSSPLHKGHHHGPSIILFFILSQVGILFLIRHHMKMQAFKGHFILHNPFHNPFQNQTGSWLWRSIISWVYPSFSVYSPKGECCQTNSSSFSVMHILAFFRLLVYFSQTSENWSFNPTWSLVFHSWTQIEEHIDHIFGLDKTPHFHLEVVPNR